jgi:archaellum biogenesis ATPase FlaH
MNNARVLQTWRERAKAKMIFISEDSGSTFDFLADGIVDLRQRHHNDRLLREIFIPKLRGVRINRPSYVYTLDNSIFHSYEPYVPSDFSISSDPKPASSYAKNDLLKDSLVKSGDTELDCAIGGGFPHGGIVNITLDSNVNEKIALTFLGQIISSFLAKGNSVLYQRSDQTNPEYISNYLKACLHTTKSRLDDLFFLVDLQKKVSGKNAAKNQHLSLYNVTKTIKKKNPNKMLLSIISAEALSQYGVTDDEKKGIDLLNLLKAISDLTVVVNHGSKNDVADYISRNSDVSMRFLEINGTMLTQSEIPWSHLCAIVIDKSHGYPHILFDPIV